MNYFHLLPQELIHDQSFRVSERAKIIELKSIIRMIIIQFYILSKTRLQIKNNKNSKPYCVIKNICSLHVTRIKVTLKYTFHISNIYENIFS